MAQNRYYDIPRRSKYEAYPMTPDQKLPTRPPEFEPELTPLSSDVTDGITAAIRECSNGAMIAPEFPIGDSGGVFIGVAGGENPDEVLLYVYVADPDHFSPDYDIDEVSGERSEALIHECVELNILSSDLLFLLETEFEDVSANGLRFEYANQSEDSSESDGKSVAAYYGLTVSV